MSAGEYTGRPSAHGCPYLGLGADRASHTAYPTVDHRCFRTVPPSEVSLQHQAVFCLSERFPSCSRYQARAAGREGRWKTIVAVAGVVGVSTAALAAAVFAVGNPLTVEPEPPTAAAGALVPATPVVTPPPETPGPTIASPRPAPASPTPSTNPASPPPTATPAAAAFSGTYVAQPGDSLTSLARRYGVSVAALAAANDLRPDAGLQTGQRLRVPATTPTPVTGP